MGRLIGTTTTYSFLPNTPYTNSYDSFGNITNSSGNVANPFRYTGRDFDSETGLYYYRARYYDPSTGRFLSEDPVRFDSGLDFYEFVLNNPVGYRDPTGLKTSVCCRPLRYIVGKIGLNHCYIKISNDQGTHTYGLHREDANNVPYPGGARPVKDDPTDTGGTCKDVKNATPCKESSLNKGFDNPNCPSCGSNYHVFSTNSNFFAPWVLEQFGMTAPNFGGAIRAPGYYGPIFPVPPFPPYPFI